MSRRLPLQAYWSWCRFPIQKWRLSNLLYIIKSFTSLSVCL